MARRPAQLAVALAALLVAVAAIALPLAAGAAGGPCHGTCASCVGPRADQCVTCHSAAYTRVDGRCVYASAGAHVRVVAKKDGHAGIAIADETGADTFTFTRAVPRSPSGDVLADADPELVVARDGQPLLAFQRGSVSPTANSTVRVPPNAALGAGSVDDVEGELLMLRSQVKQLQGMVASLVDELAGVRAVNTSCKQLHDAHPQLPTGVYQMRHGPVLCIMSDPAVGGGWTVVFDSSNPINHCSGLDKGGWDTSGTCNGKQLATTRAHYSEGECGYNNYCLNAHFDAAIEDVAFSEVRVMQSGAACGTQVWDTYLYFKHAQASDAAWPLGKPSTFGSSPLVYKLSDMANYDPAVPTRSIAYLAQTDGNIQAKCGANQCACAKTTSMLWLR